MIDVFHSVVHHMVTCTDQSILESVGEIRISDFGTIWECNLLLTPNIECNGVQKGSNSEGRIA